jgi:DNA-binding NarL/FixJ family response regulator
MTKVIIVADDRYYRQGIRTSLKGNDGIEVLETCTSADSSVFVARAEPDAVLLDIAAAEDPSVIRAILSARPSTKVIVVGGRASFVQICDWRRAGAVGYLSFDALGRRAIRAGMTDVLQARFHCDLGTARRLAEDALAGSPTSRRYPRFSTRELDVARLLQSGLTNQSISRKLNRSEETIRSHVKSIYAKLGVHHRAEAAVLLNGLLGGAKDPGPD